VAVVRLDLPQDPGASASVAVVPVAKRDYAFLTNI